MLNSKKQAGVLIRGLLGVSALGLSFSLPSYGQEGPAAQTASPEFSCLQSLDEASRGVSQGPSNLSIQNLRAASVSDNVLRDFPAAVITHNNRVSVVTPTGTQSFRIPPAVGRQTLYVVPIPGARETFPVPAQGDQPAAACRDPRSVVVVETTGAGSTRRSRVLANNTATPELLVDTSGGNPRCTQAYEGLSINPAFAGLTGLVPAGDSRYLGRLNHQARITETPQATQTYIRARISDQITQLTRDLQQLSTRNSKAIVGNTALMRPLGHIDPVPESIFVRCNNLSPGISRQLVALRRPANPRLQQLLTHNEITVRGGQPDTNMAGSSLPSRDAAAAAPPAPHGRADALRPAVLGSPIVAPAAEAE